MATDIASSRSPAKTRPTQVLSSQVPLTDEQTLVAACREGDSDAQRELYERHCQQVYRLMFRSWHRTWKIHSRLGNGVIACSTSHNRTAGMCGRVNGECTPQSPF